MSEVIVAQRASSEDRFDAFDAATRRMLERLTKAAPALTRPCDRDSGSVSVGA